MKFHLETDRLRIRRMQDSDLESFFAYRNDPEVARYQGWEVPYSWEKALAFVEGMKSADPRAKGEWFQAALEEIATGEMVGDVGYFLKEADSQATIGFTIARSHWRKGYATEAIGRLLAYFFRDLKLHRVVAVTDVDNVPSFRLLEHLGFRREGYFIENVMFKGAWGSEYYYGMLKREWKTPFA